jgi:hypothetical protein
MLEMSVGRTGRYCFKHGYMYRRIMDIGFYILFFKDEATKIHSSSVIDTTRRDTLSICL